MKQIIISILFIFSLSSLARDFPNEPFLLTSGVGTFETPPTKVTLELYIKQKSKTSKNALEQLDIKSKKLLNLFDSFKIKSDKVFVSQISKEIHSNKENFSSQYEFEQEFKVVIEDLSIYPKLMKEVLKFDSLTLFSSDFSTKLYEELEGKALLKAVKAARKKADLLAEASGVKIVGVFAISESRITDVSENFFDGPLTSNPGDFVEVTKELITVPSKITIIKYINIVFKIEQKKF